MEDVPDQDSAKNQIISLNFVSLTRAILGIWARAQEPSALPLCRVAGMGRALQAQSGTTGEAGHLPSHPLPHKPTGMRGGPVSVKAGGSQRDLALNFFGNHM